MRVLLTGINSKKIADLVISLGVEIVTSNPEVVISYGGDGTLLTSEREYPGIPKLPIRDSQFCKKCPIHTDKVLLQALKENKLEFKEFKKLHTKIEGRDLFALNEFVIRNEQTIHAIRFFCFVNGVQQNGLLIGDGLVASTPFGSTGYFKSITNKSFNQGFALAFNNLTEKKDPIYLNENDAVSVKLTRGKAILTVDNNPEVFHISEDLPLNFKLSDQVAKIYELESLRCHNCQVKRG